MKQVKKKERTKYFVTVNINNNIKEGVKEQSIISNKDELVEEVNKTNK